jgi:hypothetical protein
MNTKIKSFILVFSAIFFIGSDGLNAQSSKVRKVKEKTEKASRSTREVAEGVEAVGNSVNAIADNVNEVIRVIQPFINVFKKNKKEQEMTQTDQPVMNNTNQSGSDPSNTNQSSDQQQGSDINSDTYAQPDNYGNSMQQSFPSQEGSTIYFSDGSAYLGCLDHRKYGAYLDARKGLIYDDVDAGEYADQIDLIFMANSNSRGDMYRLFSPGHALEPGGFKDLMGERYKSINQNPIKKWSRANLAKVGLTPLTEEQFDRIQSNKQLYGVVKNVPKYATMYRSNEKLDGKVFAIKTETADRVAYALLCVVKQYGTVGSTSYLQVKLKVHGIDENGDGLPDLD